MLNSTNPSNRPGPGNPYRFFGEYLRRTYGCRVLKLPINAGLGCPNRDGMLDTAGCIFCSNDGSSSPTALTSSDITEQMAYARSSFRRSDEHTRYIAYFQSFTNTYAPPVILKRLYDAATAFPDIIGLMIGTRPDCVDNDILTLIKSYHRDNYELWIEFGMQSIHDKSLSLLNRHHSAADTLNAVNLAFAHRVDICLHIIIGIPGESWEDMMATAEAISHMPVQGVKIHHLHVIRGTPLESMFRSGEIKLLDCDEYVSVVCDFIERLRPDIMIHRLSGDRNEETLVAPAWGMHKGTVIRAIFDEFNRRGTYQGFLYNKVNY